MSRKDPTLREITAAAIIQLFDIPREHAKLMTADQIISLVQIDHDPVTVAVAKSIGWTPAQYNHPTNLHLKMILGHREKSKRDIKEIRKSDRISEEQRAFRRRVLAKGTDDAPERASRPKSKIKSRGFQKAPEGHKWFKTKKEGKKHGAQ